MFINENGVYSSQMVNVSILCVKLDQYVKKLKIFYEYANDSS